MRTLFVLTVLLLFPWPGSAQTVKPVESSDLDGIEVTRSDTYTGQSLFGYINGGADLYLEYGFVRLYVNEYRYNGEELKAEIWVMEDEASAYGVYALSHSSCTEWNTAGSFSCISRYQVAAAQGPLFISVTSPSGTLEAQHGCLVIVRKILAKNPQDLWYMPLLFQQEQLAKEKNSIRYFKGPLGLQNGLPGMSDAFEELQFKMFTIVTSEPVPATFIARIDFPDYGSANTFLSRMELNPIDFSSDPVQRSNNLYRSWYKVSDTRILYMESTLGSVNLKDYIPKQPEPYWLQNL